jgi:hypothetical protein
MTPETMEPLKHSYDRLADDALLRLRALREEPRGDPAGGNDAKPTARAGAAAAAAAAGPPDLLALLETHHAADPALSALWASVTTPPPWLSRVQLARGRRVFQRHGGACLTGLAFQSLLGGLGAARVAETLARTGGFSARAARRRLLETARMVLMVVREEGEWEGGEGVEQDGLRGPRGEAWRACVRVRLLHAAVRLRVLELRGKDEGYYDVGAWGVPASDLDCVATVASFSSTLLWQALPRQGIVPTAQEAEDYVALWRYVGHLMGTPTEGFFEDAAQARRTLESLLLFEIAPSDTSRALAHNMLASLARTPPLYASLEMLAASGRWLIGHDLGDALDLPRPGWYYYVLMFGQCLLFSTSGYAGRVSPWWDQRKRRLVSRAMWRMIVESKDGLGGGEAAFQFKWVPNLGKMTQKETPEHAGDVTVGIERRNRRVAIIGLVVLTVIARSFWLMVRSMLRMLFG